MKDVFYFRHDTNAKDDEKIIRLRMKYGWQGYGLFWALLEIMRESTDVFIKFCELDAIAFRLQCEIKIPAFVDDCIGWNLFIKTSDSFYSNRLHTDVEFMKLKSKKAQNSANSRWNKENNANALQTHSEGNAIKDSKGKDTKEKWFFIVKDERVEDLDTYVSSNWIGVYESITKDSGSDYNEMVDRFKTHIQEAYYESKDKFRHHYNNYFRKAIRDLSTKKAKEVNVNKGTPIDYGHNQ